MTATATIYKATMGWGHAPSPLCGWGYPHPLAGARGAYE